MTSPDTNIDTPPFDSIAAFRAHTRAHDELLDWCDRRIELMNSRLNAIREHTRMRPPAVEGPLRGVPITVKDNIGVSGFETWAGTTSALPAKWAQSGGLIKRLQAAGGVVTSKSHCAEFCFGGSGYNPHHGTPRNPFDLHIHRAPGGSSSGAAVAVASGMAWIGVGTDTGGSVRVPASLCGCVGFRPTHGRWPTDGLVPLSPLFDAPGIIARNTGDLSLVAAAIDRVNPRAPKVLEGMRFALMPKRFLSDCDDDIATAWNRACARLREAGSVFSSPDEQLLDEAAKLLEGGPNTAAVYTGKLIDHELPSWRDQLAPHVKRLLEAHQDVSQEQVTARHAVVHALRAQQSKLFGRADYIICPTCPVGAPAVAMLNVESYYERFSNLLLHYTVGPNLFSCCSLSIPMGADSNGIPIGLQIIGRSDEDQNLIACARSVEALLARG